MPPSSRKSQAQPSAAHTATCYPAQPRNRSKASSSSRTNGSPPSVSGSSRASSVTSPTPSRPRASQSSSSSNNHSVDGSSERCVCLIPGCGKSYNRIYDLVRHLTGPAHRAALVDADDATLVAAGVPPAHLARVQQLLGRQNMCDVCGMSYSRRDALRRHLVEAGHRLRNDTSPAAAPPALPLQPPPPGFQWALVPTAPPPMQQQPAPFIDPFAFLPPLGFEYTAPVPQPAASQQQWHPQEQALFDETMSMWFGASSSKAHGADFGF